MNSIERWVLITLLTTISVSAGPRLIPGEYNSLARAATLYVNDDTCPGTGSGTPGDPYCSIQDAIDAATSGVDEVLVHDGSY